MGTVYKAYEYVDAASWMLHMHLDAVAAHLAAGPLEETFNINRDGFWKVFARKKISIYCTPFYEMENGILIQVLNESGDILHIEDIEYGITGSVLADTHEYLRLIMPVIDRLVAIYEI
jgi:hypothetical protein